MFELNPDIIQEKNRIVNDSPFLVLLEISIPTKQAVNQTETGEENDMTVIRVVHNNEDIDWRGQRWIGFPFQLDEITEDGKELSRVDLRVCNIDRTISRYLEETDGATGTEVIFRIVHAGHLQSDAAELEETFTVQQTKADATWVTFTLGADFSTNQRVPMRRYMADFCPYQWKDEECGYTGDEQCHHTLDSCRSLENSARFGGEPTLSVGGFYASATPPR